MPMESWLGNKWKFCLNTAEAAVSSKKPDEEITLEAKPGFPCENVYSRYQGGGLQRLV